MIVPVNPAMRRFWSTAPPDEVARSPAPMIAMLRGPKKGERSRVTWARSLAEAENDGDMVRCLEPAANRALHLGAGQMRRQGRRHPDVVEPPPAIGEIPITRAIAPPGVKPLFRRDEMPDRIDEARRALQPAEFLHFDRRVADDGEELLVRPHIGFERRDVEIADEDHRLRGMALGREPLGDLVEELK